MAAVALLLLLIVVGLATCAAGRPRSVADEILTEVKETGRANPSDLVASRLPDALQRSHADGGQGRAVQDGSGDVGEDGDGDEEEEEGPGSDFRRWRRRILPVKCCVMCAGRRPWVALLVRLRRRTLARPTKLISIFHFEKQGPS